MRNGRLKTEKALSKITTLTHTTKNGFQIIGIRFSIRLFILFSFFFSIFSSFFGFFGFVFRSFGSRNAFQSVQRSFTSCIALLRQMLFRTRHKRQKKMSLNRHRMLTGTGLPIKLLIKLMFSYVSRFFFEFELKEIIC